MLDTPAPLATAQTQAAAQAAAQAGAPSPEPGPRPADPVVGLVPRLWWIVTAALTVTALLAAAVGVVVALTELPRWAVAVGGAVGWLTVLVTACAVVRAVVRPIDQRVSAERTARSNAERAAWEAHWRAVAAQKSLNDLQSETAAGLARADQVLGDTVNELVAVAEQIRRSDTPTFRSTDLALSGWPTALADLRPTVRRLVRASYDVAGLTATHQPVGVLITLARRLQPLIHRSIKELDVLESQVEDPDLLNALFQLDHLITRARRQAESIAVLGGATARQIRKPVSVYTVLRQAIAETEHYARVKVLRPVHGTIVGHAVTEVIHLLAELVENSTTFSPPDSRVQIQVDEVPDGLAIEIDDLGLVMPAEQRQRMNELLAHPERLDLAEQLRDGRIGLIVVAAIAHRYQIRVRLERNERGGNRALVVLPTSLLSEEPRAAVETAPAPSPAEPVPAPTSVPAPVSVVSQRVDRAEPGRPATGPARPGAPRRTGTAVCSLSPVPSAPPSDEPSVSVDAVTCGLPVLSDAALSGPPASSERAVGRPPAPSGPSVSSDAARSAPSVPSALSVSVDAVTSGLPVLADPDPGGVDAPPGALPGGPSTSVDPGPGGPLAQPDPAPDGGQTPADGSARPPLPRRSGQHMAPELRRGSLTRNTDTGGPNPALFAAYQRGREQADRGDLTTERPPTT